MPAAETRRVVNKIGMRTAMRNGLDRMDLDERGVTREINCYGHSDKKRKRCIVIYVPRCYLDDTVL